MESSDTQLNGSNGHNRVVIPSPLRKKMGRPSGLNNRIATLICGRLAQGRSLREICKSRRLPNASTVRDWVIKDPEFAKRYEEARKLQADYWAEEIIEIADDGQNDTYEVDGKTMVDNEAIQRSRLRVDARKWIVGKLHPKAYGERPAEVNNTVAVHNHLHITADQLTQIQQRRQELLRDAS